MKKIKLKQEKAVESILAEAMRITSGSRQENHGSPKPNHDRIKILWNGYLRARSIDKSGVERATQPELEARDVVNMMILLKMARGLHAPQRDNWTDTAGYAKCGSIIDGFEAP